MDDRASYEVVVLGSGMSGLCMGVQLKLAGIHNFVIIEKQSGIGGTWWANHYPGAHVDVPAPLYSFSFAPNPNWKSRFPAADEIQAYMEDVAKRQGLLSHLRMNTCLSEASFQEDSGRWHFKTDQGDALDAQFFVCSTGPLSQVRWPTIPGLKNFAGKLMHSAQWDHSYRIEGQRVGVIGTGSSAAQLIPELAKRVEKLYVFQRTANWVMPRLERSYNVLDRTLANFPPYSKLVRYTWFRLVELTRRGFSEGTWMRRVLLRLANRHMRRGISNSTLRDKLMPSYPLGCKRLIYSNDLLPTYERANVELVTVDIERITATGILLKDGQELALDAIVSATGFETIKLLASINVEGLHGQSLRDAWVDGPEAFHGVSVTGFPNMFLLLGPNTGTGHTSTLLYIEPEVNYSIACMKAVKAGNYRSLDVRAEVMLNHNVNLQHQLRGSVWEQCNSWYRTDRGRVTALFPGFTTEYIASLKRVNHDDYNFV